MNLGLIPRNVVKNSEKLIDFCDNIKLSKMVSVYLAGFQRILGDNDGGGFEEGEGCQAFKCIGQIYPQSCRLSVPH